jgi:hypothetical protein
MSERIRFRTPWLDETGEYPAGGAGPPRNFVPGNAPRPMPPGERRGSWLPEPPPRTRPIWASVTFGLFGVFSIGVLARAASGDGDALAAFVSGAMVLAITYVAARWIASRDNNPRVVPIVIAGLCLKLIGTYIRYKVSINLYQTGDFIDYDMWGHKIAASLREGHMLLPAGRFAGTNFIRVVTGYVYLFTPSRMMSGFVVYGWLSFVGLLFFWRAYHVAVSPKHDTTYLQWVVLLPSLIYWPSAIGKDAFMVLAAGVAAYGAACLLKDRTLTGIIAVTAGILGMIYVRPHFALAVCGGLAFATLLRRQRGSFMRTVFTLAFVVIIGLSAIQSAKSFFGISSFNSASITKQLNDASEQSSEGGSQFQPVVVHSPIQLPLAAVTVLYRPLPYESHTAQTMVTALEDVFLIFMTIRRLPRILRALRKSRDLPYILYCVGALFVFFYLFSGFSNFGILARQRAVIQPLFLVLLALPSDISELLPDRNTDPLSTRFAPPPVQPQVR